MRRIILGSALTLVLLISFYLTVIPTLELTTEKTLVRSVVLQGGEDSSSFVTVGMGKVLKVAAEVDDASNGYLLTVQDDAGQVFSRWGGIDRSSVEVGIPLYPPCFEAGKSYVLLFHAYAFNYPLPGATISDMGMVGFAVKDSETRLDLDVIYDAVWGSLYLRANLTDSEGYPVAGESVSFSLRRSPGRGITEGWILLGSDQTSCGGIAELWLAFGLPDGKYLVRASHDRNRNFGHSETIQEVQIFNMTSGSETSRFFSRYSINRSFFESGSLQLEVDTTEPYAKLETMAHAQFTTNVDLGPLDFGFFLDGTALGSVREVTPRTENDSFYVYECSLLWYPNVMGIHTLSVEILSLGFVSNNVTIQIQPCPSNLVLHIPRAVYGDTLPITAAFSKPRLYEKVETSLFSAGALAAQITYKNETYVIDEPVDGIPVELFINETLVSENDTSNNGLAYFSRLLNFSSGHVTLNLTAIVYSGLYTQSTVELVSAFAKASILESATDDGMFELNYTFDMRAEDEKPYVGAETRLKVEASLLNQSVYGLPVSVIGAKFVSHLKTRVSEWENLPGNAEYIRVNSSVYNVPSLIADVNYDGYVGIDDIVAISQNFGSSPSDPDWNPDYDLNHDNYVGIDDINIAGEYYGQGGDYYSPDYYPPEEISLLFGDGEEEVYVDSKGCARVPSDASNFAVLRNGEEVGAVVEFFKFSLDEECLTNNIGRGVVAWEPGEIGEYLVQVKLPSKFNVTAASCVEVAEVDAYLNLVSYHNVVKRPIDLAVDYTPSIPTIDDNITMVANVFDAGLASPAENMIVEFSLYDFVNQTYVFMDSRCTNSSGIAELTWSPQEYLENHPHLYYYFIVYVEVDETAETLEDWARAVVDARYPTELRLLSAEVINATAGEFYPNLIVFELVRPNGSAISNKRINFYSNGELQSYVLTNASGIACLDGLWEDEGIYYYQAVFEQDVDAYYKSSNEVSWVVHVEMTPVSVLFDVQPQKFKNGEKISLRARVVNISSGDPLEDFKVKFYRVMADGSRFYLGPDHTNSSGWAVLPHTYSLGLGVYSFLVNVSYAEVVFVSPEMLKVTNSTELKLRITKRESSNCNYIVSGDLLGWFGVTNRLIKVYVNDTLVGSTTTYGLTGHFNMSVKLESVDNKPTLYNVKAVFEGDGDPQNVSSYLYTPNGTEYTVCTTIHYGYEPAVNQAAVTVKPTSTQVMAASNMTATENSVEIAPTKTPEELQQEAEDSGWLSIWHEFSWWYPWYILHVQININPRIHIAFNPILPGGEIWDWQNLGFFSDLNEQFLEELVVDTLGLFTGYIVAKGLSLWNWPAALAAFLVKAGAQALLLAKDWYDSGKMLAAAVANFIIGLIAVKTSIGKAFLKALFNYMTAGTMSALYLLYNGAIIIAEPIQHIRTWADLVEITMDFAFGITALARYLGLV